MADKTKEIIDKAEELCVLCEEAEAEKLIRDALKNAPENLDLKTELAVVLSRQGYDQKTETILREVLATDQLHERATSALGNLLGNSLRTDEAEELFKTFLRNQPHGHIVLDDYSRLLYDSDRIEEAINLGRQHIADYPRELAAYDALRYVLAIQEDDLAFDLADNPDDKFRLQKYAENLLEQYSILQKMKDCDIVVDCADEHLLLDIDEDIHRVMSELRDVRKRNNQLEEKLPDSILNQLIKIFDVGDE